MLRPQKGNSGVSFNDSLKFWALKYYDKPKTRQLCRITLYFNIKYLIFMFNSIPHEHLLTFFSN